MKAYLWALSFPLLFLCEIACAQNRLITGDEINLIAELRTKNLAKFRLKECFYQKNPPCTINQLDKGEFKRMDLIKDETYDGYEAMGTEVVIKSTWQYLKNLPPAAVAIIFPFRIQYIYKDSRRPITDMFHFSFNKEHFLREQLDSIGIQTYKLKKPITIGTPERFTLVMMMDDIDRGVNGIYRNAIAKLDSFTANSQNARALKINELLMFYELYRFTEQFGADTSFFKSELDGLAKMITDLQHTRDTVLSLRDSLSIELDMSIEIYNDATVYYYRAKDLNSRLRLLLFLKTGSPVALSDVYCYTADELDRMTEGLFSTQSAFNFGAFVVPVRFRTGGNSSQLVPDFSIGPYVGWDVGGGSYKISILTGFGLSSVVVTDTLNNDRLAAVTPLVGCSIGKDAFQVGFFVGWDLLSGPNAQNWEYQGKTWLSFGVNYQIARQRERHKRYIPEGAMLPRN